MDNDDDDGFLKDKMAFTNLLTPYARHCTNWISYLIYAYETDTIIAHILQIRKLRLREMH